MQNPVYELRRIPIPRRWVNTLCSAVLSRTELASELARGRCLEGGQRAQQRREAGEGEEGGHRLRHGDERAAEDRHHQPGDAYSPSHRQAYSGIGGHLTPLERARVCDMLP